MPSKFLYLCHSLRLLAVVNTYILNKTEPRHAMTRHWNEGESEKKKSYVKLTVKTLLKCFSVVFDEFVTWATIYTTTYDYVIYFKWNQTKRVEAKKERCNRDKIKYLCMSSYVLFISKIFPLIYTIYVCFYVSNDNKNIYILS